MRLFSRKIIRLLLLLLLFAALAPFVLPLNHGKPLLSLERLRLPAMPEISLPSVQESQDNPTVTAYKWRDAEGNWQFASEPPQGLPYETIELDPNTNLLQGLKNTPAPAAEDARQSDEPSKDDGEAAFGYTPEKIEKVMEKARQARDALESHNKSLEGLDK
jgi:hypothetical protein